MIPVRLDVPTFIMISLRKVLTVLGLMLIFVAISFVLRPCKTCSTVSRSRVVQLILLAPPRDVDLRRACHALQDDDVLRLNATVRFVGIEKEHAADILPSS